MRSGGGRGSITPDGCPVEVYALLPASGEAERVHAAVPPGSRILDLGCGTGRVASRLAALGHDLVGVDESAEMLERAVGVTTVQARIQDLALPGPPDPALGPAFDVVLLLSHLMNVPEDADRAGFVAACRRYLRSDGLMIGQWHPPAWFDSLAVGASIEGTIGSVATRLDVLAASPDGVAAEVTYTVGQDVWTQRFRAHRLSEEDLERELAAGGLELDTWLDEDHRWWRAVSR